MQADYCISNRPWLTRRLVLRINAALPESQEADLPILYHAIEDIGYQLADRLIVPHGMHLTSY
jgi:hypothetical protein